jgi:hypothetical protein
MQELFQIINELFIFKIFLYLQSVVTTMAGTILAPHCAIVVRIVYSCRWILHFEKMPALSALPMGEVKHFVTARFKRAAQPPRVPAAKNHCDADASLLGGPVMPGHAGP